MSVMLLDVWRAARARSVPFSGESAGYVALGLCEELQRGPRAVNLDAVELCDDGALRVVAGEPCSGETAEVAVRGMLGLLLGVASSPGPALNRAAARDPGAGVEALSTELKKALIPVNRSAARRALLRLCRETTRVLASGQLASEPSEPRAVVVASVPPPSRKPSSATPPTSSLTSQSTTRVAPSPPPLPVSVAPPAVASVAPPLPVSVAPPAVASVAPPAAASRLAPSAEIVATAVDELELPVVELEPEQLTSAETVVARIRQRVRPSPPPLPGSDRHVSTPRIGSVEAAPAVPARVTRTLSPPPLPVFPEATQRAPEVRQFFAEPFDLCESAIDAVPVVEIIPRPEPVPAPTSLPEVEAVPVVEAQRVIEVLSPVEDSPSVVEEPPSVEPRAHPLADPDAEARSIAVALAIAEPPDPAELDESPALVIGVHVADTEEPAENVDDDDLETRPLLGRLPPVPYPGFPQKPSDVADLLRGFQVGGAVDETELRRELKALAGVDLTPAQPSAARPR